ncbi:MAG TPA: F0F1 ATP synthase subunit B', partial [Roseomonas sp.]
PMATQTQESTAAPEAKSGGLPQFDPQWWPGQIVWLLIIFGLLYFILVNYALPRVESVLEDRRARIAADLDAARAAKAEADAALAAHAQATAKARAEAQAAIAAATAQANAEAQTRAEALNARLNAQIAAAEARITTARDAAMGALRQVASETAESLVAKLTGRADQAAVSRAVDTALTARSGG